MICNVAMLKNINLYILALLVVSEGSDLNVQVIHEKLRI